MENIGKYKILREIGRGGMGVVYKALDTKDNKQVALKVLPQSMVDKESTVRFNREAAACEKLDHPNILKVYEHGSTEGNHFIAMEFIDGQSLKVIAKEKGKFPEKDALQIIAQVLSGLGYAHTLGMVHRDVKPQNIMVDKSGRTVIMDFGLVQVAGVTHLTKTGGSMGTSEYMSPEQIDTQEVDSRSDLYSLGATLYEMIAGVAPFTGDNAQAILMKHKFETAPEIPGISAEADKIVRKALTKNVAERYQKAEDMLADIEKIIGPVFVAPTPVNEVGTRQRLVRKDDVSASTPEKKPLPIAKIIIVLLVIGIGAGGYYVYQNGMLDKVLTERAPSEEALKTSVGVDMERLEKAGEFARQAEMYLEDGDLNRAIGAYQKALKYRPGHGAYLDRIEEIRGN